MRVSNKESVDYGLANSSGRGLIASKGGVGGLKRYAHKVLTLQEKSLDVCDEEIIMNS